jgi:hypothetical protein
MRRYNINLQNAVWVSSRDAEEELGRHSNRHNIQLWFRELMHYGFIVMVSPAHHGVNGHGKAPPQTSSLNSRRQAIRFRASHSTETIATIRRGSLP